LPGTEAKIIEMSLRAKRGETLHHIRDGKFNDKVNKLIMKRLEELEEELPFTKKDILYDKALEEVSHFLASLGSER
jgi:hypothetical protein